MAGSAGHRWPTTNSEYHEKCIAASVKALQVNVPTTGENFPQGAYRNCNLVANERIWKENVRKEHQSAKTWDRNWGFLTKYDSKGNTREKKKLPDSVTFYSSSVPATTAMQYGSKLDSESSHTIHQLERTTTPYHKRRSDVGHNYMYC